MLEVKTPEEVLTLIRQAFEPLSGCEETVPISKALGRILVRDITATEFVPDFDRSTVDGYACRAVDTFGCSDAIPAILRTGKRKLCLCAHRRSNSERRRLCGDDRIHGELWRRNCGHFEARRTGHESDFPRG